MNNNKYNSLLHILPTVWAYIYIGYYNYTEFVGGTNSDLYVTLQ